MSNWWNGLSAGDQAIIIYAAWFLAGVLVASVVAWLRMAGVRARGANDLTRVEAELDAERRVGEERDRAFSEARQQLEASFSLLSGKALQKNAESFLRVAEDRFKLHRVQADSRLGEREKAIENLVKPVTDALRKTEEQIRNIEKDRKSAFGALERHLGLLAEDQKALQRETRNLVQALRRPEVRGRWGELTLRRLVELAGMVEHCDFDEQVSVRGDDALLRPDMVIRLPDEREIVVDVKTPLDAYLTAQEATDEAQREAALSQHAKNVRARVRQLAAKAYWEQFQHSPDFAVLFIPGEQFLTAALDRDQQLLEDALAEKVILATPTSFVALLRAVAFSWRQVALIRNAEQIRELAEEFHKRVGVFSEHFARLGASLNSTVDHFNRTVGSMDRQVLPSARRLTELGVAERRELQNPESIEKQVRSPQLGAGTDGDATGGEGPESDPQGEEVGSDSA